MGYSGPVQTTVAAAPPRVSEARAAAAFGAVPIAAWLAAAAVVRYGGDHALALPIGVSVVGGFAAASVLPIGWFRRAAFGITLALGSLASVVGVLGAQGAGAPFGPLMLSALFAAYFFLAYAVAALALFAAFGRRVRDAAAVLGGFCLGGLVAGVVGGISGAVEISVVTPLLFIWIPGAVGGAVAAERVRVAGF